MGLKECLHLYLPFYALVPDEEGACLVVAINDQSVFIDSGCDYPFDEIKPILRTMDDLADFEKELLWHGTKREILNFNIANITHIVVHNPKATLLLLKLGVDLFGLIDKGLAIRKWDKYRCDMCNDSGAVTTGISEDGHTIYSTCPCVDDERN